MGTKLKLGIVLILPVILIISGCQQQESLPWEMKEAPIMTQWAAEIDPTNVWDVYPRPMMKRNNWKNLNGVWEYAITGLDDKRPEQMDGTILVPFPIESALSGVMKRVNKDDLIWYKRKLQINSKIKSDRILLNFEAVDWHAKVYIDDIFVGEHKGGFDPFSFDITKYIVAGEKHDLWVSVWDPTNDGFQPVGKQTKNPGGIFYTPSSGIWQTVWIEKVPDSYILGYKTIPDIDKGTVTVSVECENFRGSNKFEVRIKDGNEVIAESEVKAGLPATIDIPEPKLWTPDNPFLYDIDIRLISRKGRIDLVKGYFGMRKISIGKHEDGVTRIMLNNEFVFQNGPLDQGFWPDGLYTPPSEEAMVYDLKATKEMGFNMLRKHVKIEPRSFYYWTDKLGLLVWQDMPSSNNKLPDEEEIKTGTQGTDNFEMELSQMVKTLINHPSIVMWVPFNEGWGQYDTERIVDLVKELDSTRLVNNASGWTDKGVGDVHDIHHYPPPRAPEAEEDRAIVLGEFGGLGLMVKDHMWQAENWGYEKMENAEQLLRKYENFYNEVFKLVKDPGLSAVVYTQTTDVETETNGLMTYDRHQVKMGIENVAKAHAGYHAPRLRSEITSFIDSFDLELLTPAKGAKIFFTIDGTEPNESSKTYDSPITISENTTLKSLAVWENGEKSRVSEHQISKIDPLPSSNKNLKPGLSYKFYNGAWENIPDFSKEDVSKTGVAGKIDLSPAGNRTSDFGIVFNGYLNVPATDVYVIYVSSDDGGRIFLNGNQIIDYDGIHGMGEKKAVIALEKGQHPIEFQYFQHLGGQGLKVSWESSKISKEEIKAGFYGH